MICNTLDSFARCNVFDGFSGFNGDWIIVLHTNGDTKFFFHIDFPRLKPFIVNNIPNIPFFFLNIQIIPFIKMLNQLFLKSFFDKNIEKLPKLPERKVIFAALQPLIYR